MPFVTSQIYSNLVNYDDKALIIAYWPKVKQRVNYDEKNDFIENMKKIIVEVRNLRAKMNIHPSKKACLKFVTTNYKEEIKESTPFLLKLAFGDSIEIYDKKPEDTQNDITILNGDIELYMPQDGLIDLEEEAKRKEREIAKLKQEIEKSQSILSKPGFTEKAPKERVEQEQEKLEKLKMMLEKLT